MNTLYWHDYETWGADPSIDRPSQFAGVRTDENLNIIGEPLVEYCKPCPDVLPHPEACLVTGILPQTAMEKGLPEPEFISKIHAQLAVPGTVGVGYNSIRFDDEVTRYTLYRNFLDPYEREWKNGNGRWDIIDMLRFCYAVRPEGIEWPLVEGKPSFRLENLTAANGIGHESAHDAYSDVEATINLAKLVKRVQPGLYDYCYQNRQKQAVAKQLDIPANKPVLHISSMFPSVRGCAGLVAPVAQHPKNKNAVIVFDLSEVPSVLADLSVDEIRERLFTRVSDLPEGIARIPVKCIHINKAPIIATPKLLDASAEARIGIDKAECEKNWQKLLTLDVRDKVAEVFEGGEFEPRLDPERQLYDGFISPSDRRVAQSVSRADAATLADNKFFFDDSRLNQMLFRYRGRHFPDSLNPTENEAWRRFVNDRLTLGDAGCLSLPQLHERIASLLADGPEARNEGILKGLRDYAIQCEAQLTECLGS